MIRAAARAASSRPRSARTGGTGIRSISLASSATATSQNARAARSTAARGNVTASGSWCRVTASTVWSILESYPDIRPAPAVVICDFEVKHADVAGYITRQVRQRYPDADVYFAVFGAMTKGSDLEVAFEDLTGAGIMTAAGFKAVFIAATMSPPGIEPPLELR
jgi:hypothetical protein